MQANSASHKVIMEYTGISTKDSQTVPIIKHDDPILSSQILFWKQCIQPRQPCLVDWGISIFSTTQSSTLWKINKAILENAAGDQMVQVEQRLDIQDCFGQARTSDRQINITLSQFLAKLLCDDNSGTTFETAGHPGEYLYLSTQVYEEEEDAENDMEKEESPVHQKTRFPSPQYATPCRQLIQQNILPTHVDQAGNLILHSCNLWLGRSKAGSSSGLHHDFHDNFYLVKQGIKRFTLFSPDLAPLLATHGTIEKIYKNGVISYVGRECGMDGLPLLAAVESNHPGTGRVQQEMKQKKRKKSGSISSNKKRKKMRNEQDESVHDNNDNDEEEEEYLGSEMNSNDDQKGDEEEEFVIGKGFDYISSDDESHNGHWDMDSSQMDDFDRLDESDVDDDKQESSQDANIMTPPDNFSRIDLLRTDAELKRDFPNFDRSCSWTIDVTAGQMLYLPAGWFHEVRSFSEQQDEGLNLENCHVAFNYWYYPPSNLDEFDSPYLT